MNYKSCFEVKNIILFILVVFFIFFFNDIFAQAPPPPPGEEDPCGWPPGNCVPIDGGISFLLAAAAAFGAKKLYDHKKAS